MEKIKDLHPQLEELLQKLRQGQDKDGLPISSVDHMQLAVAYIEGVGERVEPDRYMFILRQTVYPIQAESISWFEG